MKTFFYASLILPAIYVGALIAIFLECIFGCDSKAIIAPHEDWFMGVVFTLTLLGVAGSLAVLWIQKQPLGIKLRWSFLLVAINMIGVPIFLWAAMNGKLDGGQNSESAPIFFMQKKWRRIMIGLVVSCSIAMFMVMCGSLWFSYRTSTQMSTEMWAAYAGKLQAQSWRAEGKLRILELSQDENLTFTGRKSGEFEIWAWPHKAKTSWLEAENADDAFVAAFNRSMMHDKHGGKHNDEATPSKPNTDNQR